MCGRDRHSWPGLDLSGLAFTGEKKERAVVRVFGKALLKISEGISHLCLGCAVKCSGFQVCCLKEGNGWKHISFLTRQLRSSSFLYNCFGTAKFLVVLHQFFADPKISYLICHVWWRQKPRISQTCRRIKQLEVHAGKAVEEEKQCCCVCVVQEMPLVSALLRDRHRLCQPCGSASCKLGDTQFPGTFGSFATLILQLLECCRAQGDVGSHSTDLRQLGEES